MSWIDSKYISLVSPRLSLFTKKGEGVYNFRCPLCGDSKKHTRKARGFILAHKGEHFYKCHNCSVSLSFGSFLKELDQLLYEDYRLERFREGHGHSNTVQAVPPPNVKPEIKLIASPLQGLQKISQLHPEHPAKKYIMERMIPPEKHFKLYFTEHYQEWVNSFYPGKFPEDKLIKRDPRVVIPLLTTKKRFFGCVGRAIEKDNAVRYITIIINMNVPRVAGLDTLDFAKKVYVTEGAFDSFFLDNAIAMCGADLVGLKLPKTEQFVFVFDNEPRNKEVVSRYEKTVEEDHHIFIWPSHIKHKDLNDCITAGMKRADVQLMVEANTFSGLRASLQLQTWKKG